MKFNQAQKHAVPAQEHSLAATRRAEAALERARLIMLLQKLLFIELLSIHCAPNVADVSEYERHQKRHVKHRLKRIEARACIAYRKRALQVKI